MAITETQKAIIQKITRKFQPKLIGVFGSYASGEQNEDSDMDLLIDFEEKINLLELIGMEQQLSDLLGIKVDLITQKSLQPPLRSLFEKDLIRIL